MKIAIIILIVVGVTFGAYKMWDYWDQTEHEREVKANIPPSQISPQQLDGLPQKLEPSLEQAQKGGPKALKSWLETTKRAKAVKDPRLAWIELDYVLMITKDDPVEAKRVFQDVKQRTPPESKIYPRIKSLEKNYE